MRRILQFSVLAIPQLLNSPITRSLLALFLFSSSALAQAPQTQPPPPPDQPVATLKVDVRLVNVFVTVLDAAGHPVGDLERKNFQVFEDGLRQEVAVFGRESERPLSIVLAIDTSLSVRKDLRQELESARRFVHAVMRPVDRLSLYQFDAEVHELVPFTADLRVLDAGIDRVRVGSSTSLYDAVYLGAEALAPRQGRKVLVVITDGGDTGSQVDYQAALQQAIQSEAIVYSIIIVPIESSAGRNTGVEHALIQFSHDTGGKYFYASTGRELDDAFRRIDRELRTQYLLAYYPKQRFSDSDFRRIQITVNAGPQPLSTRHRSGYYLHPSK